MFTLLCLAYVVFAKKYIVTSYHDTNEDYIVIPQPDEYKYEELHDSHVIGDFKFEVIESEDFPVNAFTNKNVIDIEEDRTDWSINGYSTQENPTWGLDRIDQRINKLDKKYHYSSGAGSKSTVYVLDTGIDVNHPEFEGRAKWGYDVTGDGQKNLHPHGTHCAGTIASKTYGVAKKATVVAVRVLGSDGSGSTSGIIAAIEWVVKQSTKNKVASMSLGGGVSQALNNAVAQASKKGVIFVVAAGNENQNACDTSPASEPSAITVGATDLDTKIAYFSNWGKCVNIFGPGVDILSTVPGNRTDTMSGTSMATPHVAGVVALMINDAKSYTPEQVKNFLVKVSSKDKITGNLQGSPNSLVFSLSSL